MNNLTCKFKEGCKKVKGFFVMNPHKHWKVFLYLFAVIIVCFIIFSFYLFFQIKKDKGYEPISVEANKRILLKEKLLKEVVDSFDQKALKYNEILKSQ
jgi:hypothetical protein